jgi:cbb3-type cytochrome oxidase subunit 3
MAVVAAAIVIMLLFFVGAWLFVHREGRHLLPKTQPDHEPHSYLSQPGLIRPGPPSQAA